MRKIVNLLFVLCFSFSLFAQNDILIHSHNDYRQRVPFYQAYSQLCSSIEADVFAAEKPDELLVAHDKEELNIAPTIEESYLEPLVKLYKHNGGRAWKGSDKILTLLVDLKTPANPALDILVAKLKKYPEVFDPEVNTYAVRVVISGNRPEADKFAQYPSVVSFDGNNTEYTQEQLKRISMISLNFRDYADWNGKGTMIPAEREKVLEAISKVHAANKPIRFWGTPDGVTAWNTFYNMGVDYINTDKVESCSDFFRNFDKKTYQIASHKYMSDELSRAERLDKTTKGFKGFANKKLQLSKPVEIYKPSGRNDGEKSKIKNVIFLIGDGMGLAQLYAAETVNKGLSILNMKYLGLQRTDAEDAYTTDSAGAGSGLATGKKNKNRHISKNDKGDNYPALTDVFHSKGFLCGVVTLGNAADATPAAFYGHSVERDNSAEITAWLLDGKLTLLAGSGANEFTKRTDFVNDLQTKTGYSFKTSVSEINKTDGKVICIDEQMGEAASEETLSLLANTTREAIQKLSCKKGFFLMVEGAKIDYAGHANSLPGSVLETLSFDMAVAEALKFADSNGETLVIVTGDHETGGLTLIDGDKQTGQITAKYVTDDHTPIMLPVFVYGPKAFNFTGVYPNTEIFHKINDAMGFTKR